ncbi:hypothetical protein A3J19_04215 [Candidatus Daviesbacteria bacterium RIFCSPLOWO2_02_FULL_41_8]|uniref:AI-2E family transporter n=3 Tax=Candidatus Daviesiibacteriota TaxID=1752718 RepID=A0A1F5NMC0_9BACT|nr:MAG: hypothetical protein A2871_01665 [Candidatus Daviesbacteria bacterium RIFCSPHIGHO2_01_FULL_41_23]OGE33737.1 MAG: hypothetical protein A3D83_00155 [Candidatus Daviesbacteria bacterium RIFCSPHIGHO2_02_FULL_41_10]OGE62173.1 MAG: hypothetical protein A2967_00760 [Candidatus Daviesbacteria bacterium RIFCSPLOWO2_01_FULL_41_32]OGE78664.1 MAG: hypothetical protein A3J19_04215 [Candidatus Daviesbacteria bacterium RIFCSPLOWO2_02_FULL_41_8]
MPQKIDVSHKTIIFITFFILTLWVTFLIRDLIVILFVAVIFVSALSPMVNFLIRLRLPKVLSIIITYIIIIAILSGLIISIIPPLITESNRLIVASPPLIAQFFNITNIDKSVFSSGVTSISKNLFSITIALFDNLLTIIFLLVITFYLLLDKENLENRIASLFKSREERIRRSIVKIEEKLGAWLRGQLVLSLLIGTLSYIGLTILGIPYALPLALIAGAMEVIPVIGPIVSAIPAIFIALTISPLLGVMVAGMYLIIQQLENSLIVPQVMKRAVGLNPLIVILAIAIGSRLLGISGALLAVPIAVVFQIIAAEVIEGKEA